MMHIPVVSLVLAFYTAVNGNVVASPHVSGHVKHEKREAGSGLFKRERLHKDTRFPVRIGLAQRNLEVGHDELMAISDPDSPRFGKHYTSKEVEELFAPSLDTQATVLAWIGERIQPDRVVVSARNQWIHFDASAEEMEALLHTTFHYYETPSRGIEGIGCDSYHLPHEISKHVDFITPGVHLLQIDDESAKVKRRNSPSPSFKSRQNATPLLPELFHRSHNISKEECNHKFITAACIKKIYNIHDNPPKGTSSSIGVFQSLHLYYNESDLRSFFTNFTELVQESNNWLRYWSLQSELIPDCSIPSNVLPTYVRVDGAVRAGPKFPDKKYASEASEPNLDLQAIYPLAYPHAEVVYYQVDDPVYNTEMFDAITENKGIYPFGFNTFLDAVDGSYCIYKAFGIKGNTPGIDPVYPNPSKKPGAYKGKLQCGKYKPADVISSSYPFAELSYPMAYQRRQCNEFKKLGLMGVSVLFATGDTGSEADIGKSCPGGRFGVDMPVNCPYITAVGGTALAENRTEVGGSFVSGGFSNIYPRPEYQEKAVRRYLKMHTPPYKTYNVSYMPDPVHEKGLFNRGGRAYPDVSAISEAYVIVSQGKIGRDGGTSLSTPLMAGMISRINSYRLAKGKSTLGFLNPAFYKNPEMFTDILQGQTGGCGRNSTEGFSCTPGWDPVTGLGSPIYPKMKEYLINLP